jgi:hypothetical protein
LERDDIIAEYLGFESLEKLLASQSEVVQAAPAQASMRHAPQEEPEQTWPLRTKLPLTHDGKPDQERVLPDQMRVFISWSGERSHKLAILLHDWLPSVMQAVKPYVSSENLQKGTRWPIDLARELEQTAFGILCIVPDNTGAPWLNFEAGALSKIVKDARVVPLLFDLEPSALVGHPLGQFQAAKFEKGEVLKTLKSMNELLGSTRLDPERLKSVFEQWWPKLAQEVAAVPQDDRSVARTADQHPSQPLSDLSDTEQKILAIWAHQSADLTLYSSHVVGVLQISEQQARFYLDELTKKKYLHDLPAMGGPTRYMITHKGREFLVRANLA